MQPKFAAPARRRLADIQARHPALGGRVRLLEGDITRADLGLGAEREDLLRRVTQVYHLAAVYDLAAARELATRVNVEGTRHVLWKDYADQDHVKVLTLETDEFLRCFLLHIVPRGFLRIRHFGILANRTRRATLDRCRHLLDVPAPPVSVAEPLADLVRRLTGLDLTRCPACGRGRMQRTGLVAAPQWTPTRPALMDTS